MKMDRDGSKLVISLPMDEDDRRVFLKDTFGILYHGWIDENTLYYDTAVFGEVTTMRDCLRIESAAQRIGVEVTETASAMLAEMNQKKEERIKANEVERLRTMADRPVQKLYEPLTVRRNGWKVRTAR